MNSLHPFFHSNGIVVVGASTSPEKLGYGVARNLIQSGYRGAIHLLGQKPGELFGHSLYTELSQVPDPVDLAVVIVPPGSTPATIEACGRRGIRAAIIMSSGFREVGPAGAALEQRCLEVAREHKVRLLGPNCIGTIDTHLPLDTSFLQPPMPPRGHIGFISQSGAFCAAIIDWSRAQGFGFSRIISLGNQVDLNETDALLAFAEDEHTRVIALYLESVVDGQRFVDAARQVTRDKPVVVLKAGRCESGQKAAASHTGALAASDIAFDAAFEKAGILRAESAEQMFDWARALESHPHGLEVRGRGRGVAILTNAGGPGVLAADALEKDDLPLAQLSESTGRALSTQLPPAANIHNPVDMLASASPEAYANCLRTLLSDENVTGVLVILPPPPMYRVEEVADAIVKMLATRDGDKSMIKPVVAALMGSTLVEEARSVFERGRVPTYSFPERGASALRALARRKELLITEAETHEESGPSPQFRAPLAGASPAELMKAYGIPTAPLKLAHSPDEALTVAEELGYPVVVKIASPDILHKSDVGGVVLNVSDAAALHSAYTQIVERVKMAKPRARIEGVHIQSQILQGQEVIAGAVRDPLFGPLLMFGSGGVEVEGLKDVAFALGPLSRVEASKMIRRTWAGRKLQGFRGLPPADEQSVVDILVKMSCLMLENPSVQEIEINPLRVLREGAIAVDVRVR